MNAPPTMVMKTPWMTSLGWYPLKANTPARMFNAHIAVTVPMIQFAAVSDSTKVGAGFFRCRPSSCLSLVSSGVSASLGVGNGLGLSEREATSLVRDGPGREGDDDLAVLLGDRLDPLVV